MLKSDLFKFGSYLPKTCGIVVSFVVLLCVSSPVSAQDATWNGAIGFWDVGISWTPNTQPTGTAFFTGTTPNNSIAVNGPTTIQTIEYAADAAAYTIIIGDTVQFNVTGTGVVNNSANTQTFQNDNGIIPFTNSATAGTNTSFLGSGVIGFYNSASANAATFNTTGDIYFYDNATAATATITTTRRIDFRNSSTAANSTINVNGATARLYFHDTATAANAGINISNGGQVYFQGTSTAANATFTIGNFGNLAFLDSSTGANSTISIASNAAASFAGNSTAASATITVNGLLTFQGTGTAANANITSSGDIRFIEDATAGNSTILNNAGAEIEFRNASTAGNANITNSGAIDFYGFTPTIFPNAGTATFTNNATGIINFHGASTAANATFTSTGIVEFRDDSTAGNATITNNAPGDINFFNNASAANATITNNGLMVFFNNSTAGNANITNTAGLQFSNTSTAANATITNNLIVGFVDNSTGGNARFINNASGTIDFSTTTGPLGDGAISAGSIEGAGNFLLGSNTLTVGSRNLSTEVSGIISGLGGNLIKTGIGTLTLSGINTYTGATDVWQGRLVINGSVTSNTTIFSNATLGGDGTIFGNLTVQSNGVLAPGNSIGTMTINGNATFNSAIYVVEVTPASSDRTNVSGTVQINGGIVEVQSLSPSNAYAPTQTYTIINAAGGVTGQFTSVFDDLAFYNSSLTYDANNVYLTLTSAPASFAVFANTPNTINVAAALDAANPSSALIQAMQGFTNQQVEATLPLLSGEIFATMAGAFIDESRLFRSAILSRLRSTSFAGFSGPLGYLADENSTLAYTAPAQAQGPFSARRPANRGFEYWAQAFGSWAKYDSDSNAATAQRATGGVVMGVDRMLANDLRAGFSAGYSNTQARVAERASKAEGDTLHIAAYLAKQNGNWSYRTGVSLAAHNVDSKRNVLGASLQANYFALTSQVFGEAAYAMSAGQVALEPFANLALVHNYTDGFTETGGLAALATSGFSNSMGFSSLGMRFATRYTLASGQLIIPRATLAWQHAFGDLASTATLNFQNTGTGMTIAGTPLSRDMLLTEAGLDVRISQRQLLSVFYAATVASDAVEHTVRGKYQWGF